MRKPTQRQLRVGELLRHALAGILIRDDIYDLDLQGDKITVSEVALSADLKMASVYFTTLGGDRGQVVLDALERNKRQLRGLLAKGLRLKYTPQLRFRLDGTFINYDRIDALLRQPGVCRDLESSDDDFHDTEDHK